MSLEEAFMDVQEAAEYVGCSVNFIRIRARDGRLKCYRMGKLYRFKAEDLQTLITLQNASDDLE